MIYARIGQFDGFWWIPLLALMKPSERQQWEWFCFGYRLWTVIIIHYTKSNIIIRWKKKQSLKKRIKLTEYKYSNNKNDEMWKDFLMQNSRSSSIIWTWHFTPRKCFDCKTLGIIFKMFLLVSWCLNCSPWIEICQFNTPLDLTPMTLICIKITIHENNTVLFSVWFHFSFDMATNEWYWI